jgi:hypothetical protein
MKVGSAPAGYAFIAGILWVDTQLGIAKIVWHSHFEITCAFEIYLRDSQSVFVQTLNREASDV